ncbi:hypothetical protein COP2_000715 [Malus domestica]
MQIALQKEAEMSLYDLDDTPLPNLPSAEKTCQSWIMAAVPKVQELQRAASERSNAYLRLPTARTSLPTLSISRILLGR